MTRLLREPLIHFLLIGAALFGVFHFIAPARDTNQSARQIQLSLDDLSQMVALFQSQWKREPTAEELSQLIESRVQEEVLYREALAMGLDKDDAIVRRRMAQKLQFISEDATASAEPSSSELEHWYQSHTDAFAQPARLSFRHLYFSPDRRGAQAREDAEAALVKLNGQPENAVIARSIADPFMFQDFYRDRAADALAREFGPKFAQAVVKLKAGSWQGPVESGYGWHLVFLDTVIPGRVPAFEDVASEVKAAWLTEQKAQAWEKTYGAVRAKYTVLVPAPPEGAGSAK